MALNFDKLKERLNKSQNQEKGSGSKVYWKPTEGEHVIRVVDPGDGDPFKDYHLHYNVGKAFGFLCPKRNFGDDCPVCEFAHKLWTEGNEEEKNTAKKLFARNRFYTTVLVRGEEDKGVRVLSHGKLAYEGFLRVAANVEEYGDITDVKEGTDFTMEYKTEAGASFPKTTLTPKRKTTPLAKTKKEVEELLANLPQVADLLERKSSEDVEKILNTWLHADDDSDGKTELDSKPETKKADTPTDSVDKAFGELLD